MLRKAVNIATIAILSAVFAVSAQEAAEGDAQIEAQFFPWEVNILQDGRLINADSKIENLSLPLYGSAPVIPSPAKLCRTCMYAATEYGSISQLSKASSQDSNNRTRMRITTD